VKYAEANNDADLLNRAGDHQVRLQFLMTRDAVKAHASLLLVLLFVLYKLCLEINDVSSAGEEATQADLDTPSSQLQMFKTCYEVNGTKMGQIVENAV